VEEFQKFMNIYPSEHFVFVYLGNKRVGMYPILFHFVLYFALIYLLLATLGFWMFAAQDNERFGSIPRACYTQFAMFVGDIHFPDSSTGGITQQFTLYLILYVAVVFVAMLNFLLAIVVDAYGLVKGRLQDCNLEQNVLYDAMDVVRNAWYHYKRGYPSSWKLYIFLLKDADEESCEDVTQMTEVGKAAPVTAEELYNEVMNDRTNTPYFKSEEHAQEFIDYYFGKIMDRGVSAIGCKSEFDSR